MLKLHVTFYYYNSEYKETCYFFGRNKYMLILLGSILKNEIQIYEDDKIAVWIEGSSD